MAEMVAAFFAGVTMGLLFAWPHSRSVVEVHWLRSLKPAWAVKIHGNGTFVCLGRLHFRFPWLSAV